MFAQSLILAILGIALLYSYYYYFVSDPNSKFLWGRITGNLLKVYYVSMLLSTIGFLLLFYYILSLKQSTSIFVVTACIIILSMFWMPASLMYLHKKTNMNKYLVLLVLFLVAMTSLYLVYLLSRYSDNGLSKDLAIYGITYFFIHAFFFDFITWSYNFF